MLLTGAVCLVVVGPSATQKIAGLCQIFGEAGTLMVQVWAGFITDPGSEFRAPPNRQEVCVWSQEDSNPLQESGCMGQPEHACLQQTYLVCDKAARS